MMGDLDDEDGDLDGMLNSKKSTEITVADVANLRASENYKKHMTVWKRRNH